MNAPTPVLRIVPTECLYAHEDHDSQRSQPLIERLRHDTTVINPPLVAPMDNDGYVILDGANRCFAFAELGYVHSLVQVVSYEAGNVELDTWSHVVVGWSEAALLEALARVPSVDQVAGFYDHALAHVQLRSGTNLALMSEAMTTHERNALLRSVVGTYQRSAVLQRTALHNPYDVWALFPQAVALVVFPRYEPHDIIAAAQAHGYLPAGVSRHIVHGRAVRVNYPIAALRDTSVSLEAKNAALKTWMEQKLANRQIRYYAEATYQFDE